jgi:anti-sigma regulatory factor (Ser/Thr protein kinase)
VSVRLVARAQELEVAVIDEGTPVPVERQGPPPAPPDPIDVQSIAEGGRGIYLVYQLMDTVSYECEGARNVVRLTKTFPASSR